MSPLSITGLARALPESDAGLHPDGVERALATGNPGMAGDLAEADEGEMAMTSAYVAGHLGGAIAELTARRTVVNRDDS